MCYHTKTFIQDGAITSTYILICITACGEMKLFICVGATKFLDWVYIDALRAHPTSGNVVYQIIKTNQLMVSWKI